MWEFVAVVALLGLYWEIRTTTLGTGKSPTEGKKTNEYSNGE